MSDKKNRPMSPETILATLDSISDAIDAMTVVVGELREYLDTHWDVTEVGPVALEPDELEYLEHEACVRTLH